MKYKWTRLFCVLLSVLLLFSTVYAAEDTQIIMEAVPMPEPESADFPLEDEFSMMAQAQEDSFFYAEGKPVIIKDEGGTTYAFDANGTRLQELTPDTWVFGGFLEGNCDSTSVTMQSGTIKGIYGGGRGKKENGVLTGSANVITARVEFKGGTLSALYGGGSNSNAETVNTEVTISGSAVAKSVFGGGDKGPVTGTATLTVAGGTLNNVCGGGNSESGTVENTIVHLTGGTIIGNACGGGRLGAVTNASLTLNGATAGFVFGGGEQGDVTQKASVLIKDGSATDIYGGALDNATVENTVVTVEGGTVNQIFGGGKKAATGTAEVEITGGKISSGVYGGGEEGETTTASVTISDSTGSIPGVCGGGKTGTTENSKVTLSGGTVGTIYGGDKTGGSANSIVELNGGTVGEIESGVTVKNESGASLFPVDFYVLDGDGKGLPDLCFKITVNAEPEKTVTTNAKGCIRLYLPGGDAKFKAAISGKDYEKGPYRVKSDGENRVEITLESGVTLHDSGDGTTLRFHGMGVEAGDLAVAAKFTDDGRLSEIDTAKVENGCASMTKNIGNDWKLFAMSDSCAPRCEAIKLKA